ncbi:MAG: universal stress protein [Caulobacteraceae bacterium]
MTELIVRPEPFCAEAAAPISAATGAVTGTILVHVPTEGPPDALTTALGLAKASGAALVGVAAEGLAPYMRGATEPLSGQALEIELNVRRQRIKQAADGFDFATRDIAERSMCHCEEASPEDALVRYACAADWVVAARPRNDQHPDQAPSPADLIVRTGLPVLLAPTEHRPLLARRIVVGWRDTRETRRALAAAMPLLKAAEEVLIVTIASRRATEQARGSLAQVRRRLMHKGCTAKVDIQAREGRRVSTRLRQIAKAEGADLIVVGGFGHSRLQERVLGGASTSLISDCEAYVLFVH